MKKFINIMALLLLIIGVAYAFIVISKEFKAPITQNSQSESTKGPDENSSSNESTSPTMQNSTGESTKEPDNSSSNESTSPTTQNSSGESSKGNDESSSSESKAPTTQNNSGKSTGGNDKNSSTVTEQTNTSKDEEMRGVWISTVWNLDWPSKTGLSASVQKQEFASLLDSAKKMGMNTVMVQVRPMADSIYPSEYFPWSQFLTGKQGEDPGYDPLKYMINETSKRGMKFYAWFNPFRVATSDEGFKRLSSSHPAVKHSQWLLSCEKGAKWLNPGIPEVRQYIIDGIIEVVKNYDIDGVILDDYFYPYPSYGKFSDDAAYKKYGSGFSSQADWRRNNINTFIEKLYSSIKKVKPRVEFGVSPFGIWKNKSQDKKGSNTNGMSSYDAVYADSVKWIKEEIIDFIAPQIYWSMDYDIAPYKVLVDWWAEQVRGTNVTLYIGQAASKVGVSDQEGWKDPDEYPNQILYNRTVPQVKGSIHFSISSLLDNRLGVKDVLQNKIYK